MHMLKALGGLHQLIQEELPLKPAPPKVMAGYHWKHLQYPQISSTVAFILFLFPDYTDTKIYFWELRQVSDKTLQSSTSSLLLPDNARRNGDTYKRKKKVNAIPRENCTKTKGDVEMCLVLQDQQSWHSSTLKSILGGSLD
jgi:hypothetical protein